MATTGPNLGQIEFETQGVNWYTALKALLRALDGLVLPSVLDKDLTAPPGSPANGDRYLVGAAATGAWNTHDGKIARYQSSDGTGWEFFTPKEGWHVWVDDENQFYVYNAAAWAVLATGGPPTGSAGGALTGTYPNPTLADAELNALAGLTSAADKGIQFTGSGTAGTFDLTTAAKTVLDDASVAAMLATMGGAPLASPTFTGTVTLPSDQALPGNPTTTTQASGNSSTRVATTAFVADAVAKQPEVLIIAIGDETTAITTGTAKVTFRMPFAMTLTAVRASLTTVSSSGIPTFDINESGTTVLSTKLTIDASEKTSTTAATAAVISDSALADDAEITIDVDVAGTGAAGAKIYLIGTRT